MSIAWNSEMNATPPPPHLDVAFFQEVVENALRETDVRVRNIHFAMGSKTGENYCSDIYRVRVEYELLPTAVATTTLANDCSRPGGEKEKRQRTGIVPVIVKNLLSSEPSQFLEDLQVYLKEKVIYYDVLPRMQVLLDERDAHCRFGARLYHAVKKPISSFAFEDLCASGFQMAARDVGLDETHARLVLTRLAQFHAISMHLAKMDPETMNKPLFRVSMTSRAGLEQDDSMLFRFFAGNAHGLVDLIGSWRGWETIAGKLRHYVDNLKENMIKAGRPLPGELTVLNHGDMWTNNMMFHYAQDRDGSRQPDDVIFVDFQYSVWGSPGIDINYFFYTSLQLDVLRHKREQLLRAYHEALSATLRHLGGGEGVPTFEAIRKEVLRREPYGFFAQFAITPAVTMPSSASSDSSLANLADESFARKKVAQMYESPRLQEMLRYTLKDFEAKGVWDQ